MWIEDSLLTRQERVLFTLRGLFEAAGYSRFTMSRFEEYDLYMQCKDFLVGDRMITFTDLDGRLMALKPDVTMSVVRHVSTAPGEVRKVYYNENVYRAAAHGFREIMQAGVECMGDLTTRDVCESIVLAAGCLTALGGQTALVLSNPRFVRELLEDAGADLTASERLLQALQAKNVAGLEAACAAAGLNPAASASLVSLSRLYGPLDETLPRLQALCVSPACRAMAAELEAVGAALAQAGLPQLAQLDFSVSGNMDYYDGIVFQGFVRGVPRAVLSGGQYGGLMQKMGKSARAVGFAIYADELGGAL